VLPTLDQLVKEYPDKVRVFFKQESAPLPRQSGAGRRSGAGCRSQGKFWKMHDQLLRQPVCPRPAGAGKSTRKMIGLSCPKSRPRSTITTFKARGYEDAATPATSEALQGTLNSSSTAGRDEEPCPMNKFKTVVG